ncbi:hypothetical protein PRIPAC_96514 [Pristionchus pacificus]|uniref:Uncharacterized protein n=1 Tax=Pristionchus pacificus TaxID=54126 RepID=A0A2A6D162_PRIPA|nr:hypothetical protein PRIPAC_96514 [Pristionchus pacificus]|eukprot:PDM84047.1 hypothetical protein PRIPAC_34239 [Pristionchus pacificus]
MRLLAILLLSTFTVAAASTIGEEIIAASLLIEELKAEEKAASKAFHDELSNQIEANIDKIGERIKGVFTEFNKTKDPSILKEARDKFATNLANGIGKLKELKDEIKEKQMEAWEANKAKIQERINDVATILDAAKNDLIGVQGQSAAPKDLNAAINRLNGSSSWQTASILLMVLSVILIATVAVLIVKQMNRSGGYDKLGGGNRGLFVPTQSTV